MGEKLGQSNTIPLFFLLLLLLRRFESPIEPWSIAILINGCCVSVLQENNIVEFHRVKLLNGGK